MAEHGGKLVARALKSRGVEHLFTLSVGHLFSIYDGCRAEGIELIDVRHEQTAAFAAEGWAKVTRTVGVCALTAGPGVTNGMSAMASASQNGSPIVVLGGRAPEMRWGQGSLQEIDHVPFVGPVCKSAATARATDEIPGLVDGAFATALAPRSGPAFVDFPLDVVFGEGALPGDGSGFGGGVDGSGGSLGGSGATGAPDGSDASSSLDGSDALQHAVALLSGAERPVIMAGTGL